MDEAEVSGEVDTSAGMQDASQAIAVAIPSIRKEIDDTEALAKLLGSITAGLVLVVVALDGAALLGCPAVAVRNGHSFRELP